APTPSVKPGTVVVCDESVANLTLRSVFNQDAPGEAIKEHARGGGDTGFPVDRRDPIRSSAQERSAREGVVDRRIQPIERAEGPDHNAVVPGPEIVAEDNTAAERVAIVGELDLVGVGVALGRVQASAVLDALEAGIKSGLGAGCVAQIIKLAS